MLMPEGAFTQSVAVGSCSRRCDVPSAILVLVLTDTCSRGFLDSVTYLDLFQSEENTLICHRDESVSSLDLWLLLATSSSWLMHVRKEMVAQPLTHVCPAPSHQDGDTRMDKSV